MKQIKFMLYFIFYLVFSYAFDCTLRRTSPEFYEGFDFNNSSPNKLELDGNESSPESNYDQKEEDISYPPFPKFKQNEFCFTTDKCYKIHRKLGSGKYGTVYKVRELNIEGDNKIEMKGKYEALKITENIELKDARNFKFHVNKLAKNLKDIPEQNIIVPYYFKVYSNGNNQFVIASLSNFIDGIDLFKLIDEFNGYLPKKSIDLNNQNFLVSVSECIVEAVETLHKKGYAHNDIAPRNIMITPGSFCELIDLDLSAWLDMYFEDLRNNFISKDYEGLRTVLLELKKFARAEAAVAAFQNIEDAKEIIMRFKNQLPKELNENKRRIKKYLKRKY